MAVRVELHFDAVGDGYNTLAVIVEVGLNDSERTRASLIFDARDGRLEWFSAERSGTTDEFGARPLVAILSIVEGDDLARQAILDATKRAKALVRRRVRALRASGSPADARVAASLERALESNWLRLPR